MSRIRIMPEAGNRAPDLHSFLALLADLCAVVLNDVLIGESESFKLAAAPTSTQRKAFDLFGVNPSRMFPEAGRQDSANRFPAKENLRFCAVKFSLNCRQFFSLM